LSYTQTGCHVFGKIKFVDFGEDYKVKFVDFGEDLNVKIVDFGEKTVGKWKYVSFGEDFKVKIVDFGEDFKVKIVDFGYGCKDNKHSSSVYELPSYVSVYVPNYDHIIREIRQNKIRKYDENIKKYAEKAEELFNIHENSKLNNVIVPDGWHRVIKRSINTNGVSYSGFTYEIKVKVIKNHIVEIWGRSRSEDLIYGNPTAQIFSPWSNKNVIQLNKTLPIKIHDNGFAGDLKETLSFIFFLSNPDKIELAPKLGGSVSLWTDSKKYNGMKFYIKEFSMTTTWWNEGFTGYFKNREPLCGQEGTLNQKLEPGTYTIYAIRKRKQWGVKITVRENECTLIKITDEKWKL